MTKYSYFSSILLICAAILFPRAAAAADAPIAAEAVETARSLIKASAALGARTAAETRRRDAHEPALQAQLQSASKGAGFQKFLKLKNLCVDKSAGGEGLVIVEGDRTAAGGHAFDALLANFKAWDGGDAAFRKAADSCLGPGDYCSSSMWCCGAMACRNGVCGGAGSSCIPRGRPCGGSIWCCGTGICNDRGYCQ